MTTNMKFCRSCRTAKVLETSFYKAGRSWQAFCKDCHNKNRAKFRYAPRPSVKKPKGWDILNTEVKDTIRYCLYVRISCREISRITNIKYTTLMNWKFKGIPPWNPETDTTPEAYKTQTTPVEIPTVDVN